MADTTGTRFSDFGLKKEVLEAIRANGFESPSDIQTKAIPYALEHTDLLCQAKSGKGKTAVFVLSILHMVNPDDAPGKIQALILCNTHELATQITQEFERFSKGLPAVHDGILCTVGGVSVNAHVKTLEKHTTCILVGTVGRVYDLFERKALALDSLRYFVVDEFDTVLKEEACRAKISKLAESMPKEHQTMLFTATLTEEARQHATALLREPFETIAVDDNELVLTGLIQHYMTAPEEKKLSLLTDCLNALHYTQAVVFASATHRAAALAKYLRDQGHQCDAFYSRLPGKKRDLLYKSFKNRDARLLVATDVFQRGVDFEGVNLVINFDMPDSSDSYLHRAGRAGRFETSGLVLSFVGSDEDRQQLEEIQKRFMVDMTEVQDLTAIDQKQCFANK